MSMQRIQCLLLLLLLLVGQGAGAGVYRWVDEDGRVHYGDRPPASEAAEATIVETQTSPPSSSSSVPNPSDRNITRQRLLDQYQKEREEKKAASQKNREEKQRREIQCAQARARLENYQTHPILYEPLANGKRRYFSDAEHAQAVAAAEQEVARWCD